MALGKAYIEVHADTKPFARELGRELNRIIKATEAEVKVKSKILGGGIGKGVAAGLKKETPAIKKATGQVVKEVSPLLQNGFAKLSKGVIDTIDDGISGLPDELKVVLGAALIAAAPIILALGSAVAASLVAGLTLGGLGLFAVLIGSQLDQVSNHFKDLTAQIQTQFQGAVGWLAGPINQALDLVAVRFKKLLPAISFFGQAAASVLQPLVDAVFGLVEFALPGLKKGLFGISKFLLPLQVGFRNIGAAVGRFFSNILNNPQAVSAFYDLLVFVEDLIDVFTDLISIGLAVYGVFRKIAEVLGLVAPVAQEVTQLAKEYGIGATNANNFSNAITAGKEPLQTQQELLENINKELDTYTNLTIESGNNTIDFEEHIDNFTKAIKENGRTLDTGSEKGRENARALRQLAVDALKTRQTTIDLTGDISKANYQYSLQVSRILELSKQMKLSKTDTDKLIGSLISIPPPQDTGPSQGSVDRLKEYYKQLKMLQSLGNIAQLVFRSGAAAGVNAIKHANGGVFNSPHVGMVAEAGPEAIIPLNRPGRAAQVMQQAGLSGMMNPSVNVYIGNQQIDAYIDNRVNSAMRATSRSLSYGSRNV